MTQYELEVLMKIIMGLVALALFGIVCYVFGKSKAEIFPEYEDVTEVDLQEAFKDGYEAGYSAARATYNKKLDKRKDFDYEEI